MPVVEQNVEDGVEVQEAPKKAAKKAATVTKVAGGKGKVVKKAAEKKKEAPEYGVEKKADVPWCEKKVILIKTLKALRAFNAQTAVPASKVIEKCEGQLTSRDVRHYSYHAMTGGLTSVDTVEGIKGYAFSLTKKGQEIDPVKAFKDQEKAKADS